MNRPQTGCFTNFNATRSPFSWLEHLTEEDVPDRTEAVFLHVFRAYPTVPSPCCENKASWTVVKN